MTETIKPSHAISLWATPDILYVELPNPNGEKAHYLRLPLNVWGMTQLVEIVKARHANSKIGEKGDQTQAQADKEIRDLMKGIDPSKIKRAKPSFAPHLREAARNVLKNMGIGK